MLTQLGASLRRWRRRLSRAEWTVKSLRLSRSTTPSHSPGLLLIQIDGLSRVQFERALAAGRLPFLRHLIKHEGSKLHTFYSGLPSTTPAVQGELYYGERCAVPGFSFLDPRANEIGMMMYPSWAKRIEADLASRNTGLLTGGSSWSNIYTGGATQEESHFCGASMHFSDMWQTGKIRNIFLFGILHFTAFIRLIALLLLETFIALYDLVRGFLRGHSLWREFVFLFGRVFVCIGLRELITLGAKVDLARGLPIIHVNFLGYDEQSHRRGPGSRFAHWTLQGIDRSIRHLHRAARRSEGRDYEVWIFSDHGQVDAISFFKLCSNGLEGAVRRNWPGLDETERNKPAAPQRYVSHSSLPFGSARLDRHLLDRSHLTPFESTEFAVACLGPVGHVYCKRTLEPAQLDALIAGLLKEGVPGILRRIGPSQEVVRQTATGIHALPGDKSLLRGPDEQLDELATDLVRLARQPFAGDLVCLGWHPGRPTITFAHENGAHCGPSPDEVQGFLLMPPASDHLVADPSVRPSELRDAALRHLGRKERKPKRRRTEDARRVRVVTYNVHYCKGLDGRFAPERISRVLRSLDPDIVALQELDRGRSRSRRENQIGYLAEQLGMNFCFCPSIEFGGEEQYGHGLLAHSEFSEIHRARLPAGGVLAIEPRDAMAATLQIYGRAIRVIGTHLGLSSSERAAQIDRLLATDFLGGIDAEKPAIFLGDLNLVPGGSLYRRLVRPWSARTGTAHFRDAQAHAPNHTGVRTFPSFWPVRCLDHIFVTAPFSITRVFTPANLLTRRASDHLPLVADLELHAT